MNISKQSWHYWLWQHITQEVNAKPSVCNYWFTVLVAPWMLAVLFVVFLPAMPIILLAGWLEDRYRNRTICPFGRVTFK